MQYTNNHTLTEEQMAAYLDGMLAPEEVAQVERLIGDNDTLQEIQEAIDDVDDIFLADNYDVEVPSECLEEHFILPDLDAYLTDTENINLFDTDSHDLADDYYQSSNMSDGYFEDYADDDTAYSEEQNEAFFDSETEVIDEFGIDDLDIDFA